MIETLIEIDFNKTPEEQSDVLRNRWYPDILYSSWSISDKANWIFSSGVISSVLAWYNLVRSMCGQYKRANTFALVRLNVFRDEIVVINLSLKNEWFNSLSFSSFRNSSPFTVAFFFNEYIGNDNTCRFF